MAQRFLLVWMLAAASIANVSFGDATTAAKYKSEADAIVQEQQAYSGSDLARLSRGRAWNVMKSFRKGMDFLQKLPGEANLTDEEKQAIAVYVGDATGKLAERLSDGFVDAKLYDRSFSSMRREGYSWIGSSLRVVRDFFVGFEVNPFRFRDRELSDKQWTNWMLWTPLAFARASFERVVRLFPGTLRTLSRLFIPGQWIESEFQWSVPPALPFIGSDRVRDSVVKDLNKEVKLAFENAFEDPKNHWALAVLLPVAVGIQNAEPFKLNWTNRSMRRWNIGIALWLLCNPLEITRREMGGLEYGVGEFLLFMATAYLHHYSTGIGTQTVLGSTLDSLHYLAAEGGHQEQYACARELLGQDARQAPTNRASSTPRYFR